MGPDRTDSFDFDALYSGLKLRSRINGCFNLLLAALLFARKSGNHRYDSFEMGLFRMNVTPLLSKKVENCRSSIGSTKRSGLLDVLMRPDEGGACLRNRTSGGELSTKLETRDKRVLRKDPRGYIDARMRIDAMSARPEFEGIEGELTEGELMAEAMSLEMSGRKRLGKSLNHRSI